MVEIKRPIWQIKLKKASMWIILLIILSTYSTAWSNNYIPYGMLTEIDWKPDSPILVAAEDNFFDIFKLQNTDEGYALIHQIQIRGYTATSQVWNQNGTQFLSALTSGSIILWDPIQAPWGSELDYTTIPFQNDHRINEMKWNSNDLFVLTENEELFQLSTNNNYTIENELQNVVAFDINTNDGTLMYLHNNKTIVIENNEGRYSIKPQFIFPKTFRSRKTINQVSYQPQDTVIKIIEFMDESNSITLNFENPVLTYEWNLDGSMIAISFKNSTIGIYNISNGNISQEHVNKHPDKTPINIIDWNHNNNLALVADYYFTYWDLKENTFITPYYFSEKGNQIGFISGFRFEIFVIIFPLLAIFFTIKQRIWK